MLACMTSPIEESLNWKPKDLDVYCHSSDNKMCSHCQGGASVKSEFCKFLCSERFNGKDNICYPILSIIKNREWKYEKLPMFNEIIIENGINIKDFITKFLLSYAVKGWHYYR